MAISPISFETNQGQFDSRVKFVSRGNGCTMFLTANEAVFQLRDGDQLPHSKFIADIRRLRLNALRHQSLQQAV
jgi:hypothetical protein